MRLHNKKHTKGRKKRSVSLNNWNNRPDICARHFATPEVYALYLKRKAELKQETLSNNK